MARTSSVTPVLSRDSRVADRPGPAERSPFRSAKVANRIVAARQMIEKREREIAAIEKALGEEASTKVQRLLTQRLLASRNNLHAWQDYLTTAEREPRAVIIPA